MAQHKAPAFQFYAQDWLSSLDISMMSIAEEGGYHRLLAWAWTQADCGLPSDDVSLSQLSRLGDSWISSKDKILKKFRLEGGRYYNDRLLVERAKQDAWRRKSSEGGKKSAALRKGGSRVVEGSLSNGTNQNPTLQSSVFYKTEVVTDIQGSSAIQELKPAREKPDKTESPEEYSLNDPFEKFKALFRGAKPASTFQAFMAAIRSPEDVELLLVNTALWMNTPKYRGGYGDDAKWFLREGIWREPPPDEHIKPKGNHQDSRPIPKRATTEDILREKAARKQRNEGVAQ